MDKDPIAHKILMMTHSYLRLAVSSVSGRLPPSHIWTRAPWSSALLCFLLWRNLLSDPLDTPARPVWVPVKPVAPVRLPLEPVRQVNLMSAYFFSPCPPAKLDCASAISFEVWSSLVTTSLTKLADVSSTVGFSSPSVKSKFLFNRPSILTR